MNNFIEKSKLYLNLKNGGGVQISPGHLNEQIASFLQKKLIIVTKRKAVLTVTVRRTMILALVL